MAVSGISGGTLLLIWQYQWWGASPERKKRRQQATPREMAMMSGRLSPERIHEWLVAQRTASTPTPPPLMVVMAALHMVMDD